MARLALGNDPEIRRMFGADPAHLPPLTAAGAAAWAERLARHPHAWVVEYDGRLLGEARLDGVDLREGRARLAIGFYDPARLGMGLGCEAVRAVLSHAFGSLGLHRVSLRVIAYDTRAVRCYLACGFVVEGREREAARVGGEWHDDVIMGVISPEFLASEQCLLTGRTMPGVVRTGDAVHRPPALNADLAHRLLRHLEAAGFEGAPRFLGCDGQGRDMLGWIEGTVPAELSAAHSDEVLLAAARLIRRYHDATAPLLAAPAAAGLGLEVVYHNDLSPCNFVSRAGAPVAIIDFDAAMPGARIEDLGYAAWLWLDLGGTEVTAPAQRRRLQVFLDAYGPGPTGSEVVGAILRRQELFAVQARRIGDTAMRRWAECSRAWTQACFPDGSIT